MPALALAVASAAALAACGGASAPPVEEPPAEEEPGPEVAVSLRLEARPEDEMGMPSSDAALVLIQPSGERSVTPLGVLNGVCSHEEADERDVLRVRCWWAGAGRVIRVSRDGDELVVRWVDLDEEVGAHAAEEMERVALPARARLRPIAP